MFGIYKRTYRIFCLCILIINFEIDKIFHCIYI